MNIRRLCLLSGFACVAILTGCANTTTGKFHAPLDVKPTDVCIIRNPSVQIDAAIPSLQIALQRRGIASTVVDNATECKTDFRLNYVMRRSWDVTTYLGSAQLTLLRNNTVISTANYEAGDLTLTKWGKTEQRIDGMVGKLLGE